MKKTIIFALFLLTSMSWADCNREVQFVGKVRNLKTQTARFSFQLSLGNWYSPSIVCPLYEDEFVEAVIEIEGKPLIANGDEISGVLVFDQKTQTYRID